MTVHAASFNDPHADPERWAPRLARLLDEQVEIYEQLERLSVQQSECIASEDSDALLMVLAQRQDLIDRLDQSNQHVEPFKREWARLDAMLPSGHRDALRAKFEAITRLVGSITARDEADRKRLEADRQRIAVALEGAGRARGAVGAYAAPKPTGPVFQDWKG